MKTVRFFVELQAPDELSDETLRDGVQQTLEMEYYIDSNHDPTNLYLKVQIEKVAIVKQMAPLVLQWEEKTR